MPVVVAVGAEPIVAVEEVVIVNVKGDIEIAKVVIVIAKVVIVNAKGDIEIAKVVIVIAKVVIVLITEDNNYISYFLHIAFVAVANDDLCRLLFLLEDREDVKVVFLSQGGTSPHGQRHHRHHSGNRKQQNNALHAKRHLLNREGGELPRPVS
jgi:hypothetical protein